MISLYHGTTRFSADRILEEGWTVQDPLVPIASVAREYQRDPEEILDVLESLERFATGEGRGRWASFALNKKKAIHSWAQRAPELRWEALCCVWHLDHPGIARKSGFVPRAAASWVFQQMQDEPLAIVETALPYEDLVRLNAITDGFGTRDLLPEHILVGSLGIQVPGVAIPCPYRPDPSSLKVHPVDRDVPWVVFADLLGLDDEEFRRRASAGIFGSNASDGVPHDLADVRPWWSLSSVVHLLPSKER